MHKNKRNLKSIYFDRDKRIYGKATSFGGSAFCNNRPHRFILICKSHSIPDKNSKTIKRFLDQNNLSLKQFQNKSKLPF